MFDVHKVFSKQAYNQHKHHISHIKEVAIHED